MTDGFPVLSAGPTPHTPLAEWTFSVRQGGGTLKSWTWQELQELPAETVTVDIHCVTRWSKLDTEWRGVSVDTLLDQVGHDAGYVMAFSDGGYTTNLPLADVTGGKAWVAFGYGGAPLEPEHGGPARLLVPHLYFWKSAKWVRGLELWTRTSRDSGRPTATTCTETHGRNSGTRATDLAGRDGHRRAVGDAVGAHRRAGRPVLAGPPRRAAPGRAADGRGRLQRRAVLLDRDGGRGGVAITVERLDDGEVSPYLTDELRVGDQLELRGPVGGYFVWEPADGGPLVLLGGGSGIVPLRAILRERERAGSDAAVRLLYSARTASDLIYRDELAAHHDGVEVIYTLTRKQPAGWTGYTRRVDRALLAETAWPRERTRWRSPAGRQASSRSWPAGWSPSAISPAGSRPSGSAEREDADGRTRRQRCRGPASGGLRAEMTTAVATCASCGAVAPIGESDLYLGGPGTVIRCRHCTSVLIVITQIRGMHCVDLMGMRELDTEGTPA